MEYRKIKKAEMIEAIELVWEVFLEYEAPYYTEEGVNNLKNQSMMNLG